MLRERHGNDHAGPFTFVFEMVVVNFVDLLGHSRSESNILKELIPNESAYRHAIQNWFEKSWLNDSLNVFNDWNADIVITADHGNTQVTKPIKIKADQTASLGLRSPVNIKHKTGFI